VVGVAAGGVAVAAAAFVPPLGHAALGAAVTGVVLATVTTVVFLGLLRVLDPGAVRVLRDV
ncbi:MAG: hypothetical protein JJD92_07780, partial [Frankiaceae bacterium]|nr:hypothetical protein [Frankiaceae bacterium]